MLEIGPKLVPKIGQNFLFLENKKKLANRPEKSSLVEAYAKGHVLKPAGLQILANGVPEAKTGHCPKYHLREGSTAPIILTRTPVRPEHDFEPKWPLGHGTRCDHPAQANQGVATSRKPKNGEPRTAGCGPTFPGIFFCQYPFLPLPLRTLTRTTLWSQKHKGTCG